MRNCQIFQLVKSLADFPNTVYLLSYDKEVVKKALEKVQTGFGEEYLKKIVKLRLEIPATSNFDVEKLFIDEINEIFLDMPKNSYKEVYWGNIYNSGIKYFLNNFRDTKRYINTLKIISGIVKNEVNPVDFIAIIAIQVFIPDVYYEIRGNQELFIGTFDNSGYSYSEMKKKDEERCDEIIKKADEHIQDPLKSLLKYMFPRLEAIYGNSNYGNEWLSNWRKELRICSPDKFRIYSVSL